MQDETEEANIINSEVNSINNNNNDNGDGKKIPYEDTLDYLLNAPLPNIDDILTPMDVSESTTNNINDNFNFAAFNDIVHNLNSTDVLPPNLQRQSSDKEENDTSSEEDHK